MADGLTAARYPLKYLTTVETRNYHDFRDTNLPTSKLNLDSAEGDAVSHDATVLC